MDYKHSYKLRIPSFFVIMHSFNISYVLAGTDVCGITTDTRNNRKQRNDDIHIGNLFQIQLEKIELIITLQQLNIISSMNSSLKNTGLFFVFLITIMFVGLEIFRFGIPFPHSYIECYRVLSSYNQISDYFSWSEINWYGFFHSELMYVRLLFLAPWYLYFISLDIDSPHALHRCKWFKLLLWLSAIPLYITVRFLLGFIADCVIPIFMMDRDSVNYCRYHYVFNLSPQKIYDVFSFLYLAVLVAEIFALILKVYFIPYILSHKDGQEKHD